MTKKEKKAEALSRLEAQKIMALQNGQTKVAAQIQKVIDLINKK
jgi:hypothetical protein